MLPDTMGSGMLQEDYCADCYRLIVACLLMSRVSSHDCKTRCINGFFAAFPTPSDVKVFPLYATCCLAWPWLAGVSQTMQGEDQGLQPRPERQLQLPSMT